MKHLITILILTLNLSSKAQEFNPVKLAFSTKRIDQAQCEIRIIAFITQPWHIYSQNSPAGGPQPTRITFSKNPLIKLKGGIIEIGNMTEKFEKTFDMNVKYYSQKLEFIQFIKIKPGISTLLTGEIEYMACTDEKCIPPIKKQFKIKIEQH